jgi:hypothetical protein
MCQGGIVAGIDGNIAKSRMAPSWLKDTAITPSFREGMRAGLFNFKRAHRERRE